MAATYHPPEPKTPPPPAYRMDLDETHDVYKRTERQNAMLGAALLNYYVARELTDEHGGDWADGTIVRERDARVRDKNIASLIQCGALDQVVFGFTPHDVKARLAVLQDMGELDKVRHLVKVVAGTHAERPVLPRMLEWIAARPSLKYNIRNEATPDGTAFVSSLYCDDAFVMRGPAARSKKEANEGLALWAQKVYESV